MCCFWLFVHWAAITRQQLPLVFAKHVKIIIITPAWLANWQSPSFVGRLDSRQYGKWFVCGLHRFWDRDEIYRCRASDWTKGKKCFQQYLTPLFQLRARHSLCREIPEFHTRRQSPNDTFLAHCYEAAVFRTGSSKCSKRGPKIRFL